MNEKIIIAIVATIGPLAGIALSELFGRWKRREEYKRILFNTKLNFYSDLVASTANVFKDLLFDKEFKIPPNHFSKEKSKTASLILANVMFSSSDVSRLVEKFMRICEAEDITLEERVGKLANIHSRLNETCKAELGLEALAKDLNKFS